MARAGGSQQHLHHARASPNFTSESLEVNVYSARACGGGGGLSDDDIDSDDDDELYSALADDACDEMLIRGSLCSTPPPLPGFALF